MSTEQKEDRSACAIIVAAGRGERLGQEQPKAFVPMGDRSLLAHTLAVFDKHPRIGSIILVVPAGYEHRCRQEVVEPSGSAKVTQVVAGGDSRQNSVHHGLQACNCKPRNVVVIHDAARPLVSADIITEVIDTTQALGCCITAIPVQDTVKKVKDGLVQGTPERDALWFSQTPQAFRLDLIRHAHEEAQRKERWVTDDAALAEWLGQPISVVEGSSRNFKITTADDLLMATALWQASQ